MANTYKIYFRNSPADDLQSEKFTGTRAQIERAYDGKIVTAVDDLDCAEALAMVARLQSAEGEGINALTMDTTQDAQLNRPDPLVTGKMDCPECCPVKDIDQIRAEADRQDEIGYARNGY